MFGVQIPVIPLIEVFGNVNEFPEQIGPTWLNVGVVSGLTVTVSVVVIAH